jgi:drug/metabolite transporter (DMT)-like permease
MNLFRYFLNCVIYFIVKNMAFFTMYFANRSPVNVGVIITIWSIEPFFNSVADYFIYGQKMHYYHIIGVMSMVICSVVICMKDFMESESGDF